MYSSRSIDNIVAELQVCSIGSIDNLLSKLQVYNSRSIENLLSFEAGLT